MRSSVLANVARGVMIAALAACASSGAGGATRSSPDKISRSEINSSNVTNAYELISRLRPSWLRSPPTGSISGGVVRSQSILVYLDRQRLDDLNALKTISVEVLDSAQWIDAARVQTVLNDVPNNGMIAGAIVLKTR